jgi:hypothetical protein
MLAAQRSFIVQEFRREFGADPGRMPLQAIMFSAQKPA